MFLIRCTISREGRYPCV